MSLFNLSSVAQYPVKIWRPAISESMNKLNYSCPSNGIILELAGGSSPLSAYINPCFLHIVIDKEKVKLVNGQHKNIVADVVYLPIKDNSATVIFTISSLQYFDQNKFFMECHRVLDAGGILAIHENGPSNPFILFARLAQRVYGVFFSYHWRYRNSIVGYYNPDYTPAGFEVLFRRSDGIFSPICLGMELLNIPCSKYLIGPLRCLDNKILTIFPSIARFSFLNIAHFRKI